VHLLVIAQNNKRRTVRYCNNTTADKYLMEKVYRRGRPALLGSYLQEKKERLN